MIYILHTTIDESNHENLMFNFLPNFSIEFQNKIKKYRRWQDAQLSLLGRILLVEGMKQMKHNFYDYDIQQTSFNKPYFDKSDTQFNISHSGQVAICVITNKGHVGIDIEKINNHNIFDFKSQMTTNEWELVSKSKNTAFSFLEYWTQKEAVIKAHGKGLSIPLKSFEVKNNIATIESENFFLKKIEIQANYICYLALKESINIDEINIHQFNFNNIK